MKKTFIVVAYFPLLALLGFLALEAADRWSWRDHRIAHSRLVYEAALVGCLQKPDFTAAAEKFDWKVEEVNDRLRVYVVPIGAFAKEPYRVFRFDENRCLRPPG